MIGLVMSVLFITITTILSIFVFRIKKSEASIDFITDIFISIMSVSGIHAVEAIGFSFLRVPISIITIGFFDLILIIILFFVLTRNKGVQKHSYKTVDFIMMGMLLTAAGLFILLYFKSDLSINYFSTDASRHMAFAKCIAVEHVLPTNLYLSALNDGILMELINPLISGFYYYKVFNIAQGIDYLVAGMAFCACVRRYCNGFICSLVVLIMTCIYWIGYPLYAIEGGFSYFGTSVTVIIFLIIITNLYILELMSSKSAFILLNIGLFELFVSYTLFVPVVFLGIFTTLLVFWRISGDTKCVCVIIKSIKVFAFPCIFGLLASYRNLLELSPGGGISFDGGCNNDVFSNFMFLVPLSICSVIISIVKKHRYYTETVIFPILILFMIVLFIGGMLHKVSVYYYVKNNNLLWLVSFLLTVDLIIELMREYKELVLVMILSYSMFLGAFLVGVDQYFYNMNNRFSGVLSMDYFNIFSFNKNYFHINTFSANRMELYRYIYDMNLDDNDEVLSVGDEYAVSWMISITDQKKILFDGNISDLKKMIDGSTHYICVFYGDMYYNNKQYFDSLGETLFQNDDGFVLRLNEKIRLDYE